MYTACVCMYLEVLPTTKEDLSLERWYLCPFPGGKALPGRDSDHSPPSSAEVVNEYELYFLSPQAPPWRVAGRLYFFTFYSTTNILVVYLLNTSEAPSARSIYDSPC
jgi:hypothetical protein